MKFEAEIKTDKPGPEQDGAPCWVARKKMKSHLDWYLCHWNEHHQCWDDDEADDHFCEPGEAYCWMPLPTPTFAQIHQFEGGEG